MVVSGSLRAPQILANEIIEMLGDSERFCFHSAANETRRGRVLDRHECGTGSRARALRGSLYPSDADSAAPIVGSDPGGQTRRAAVGQRSETGRIGGVECRVNRWIVSLVLTTLTGTALASAPMQKTQSPGFYRTMLGEFEVTVLSDGVLPFKVQGLLTNITPPSWIAILHSPFSRSRSSCP